MGDGLRRSPAPELLRGRIKEFSTAVESFTAKDGLSDDIISRHSSRPRRKYLGRNQQRSGSLPQNEPGPGRSPLQAHLAGLGAGDAGDVWVEDHDSVVRVHGGRADRGRPYSASVALVCVS